MAADGGLDAKGSATAGQRAACTSAMLIEGM
jgi:hypothetical protein